MVAIAVGGSSDSYGGNATVKSVDTSNRIINYITSGNELKAAYYAIVFLSTITVISWFSSLSTTMVFLALIMESIVPLRLVTHSNLKIP